MSISNPLLRAHLETGQIAPTYLFTGTPGEAKDRLVLDFVGALNAARTDVRRLGEDPKARSIKIDEIRNLTREASLKPFEGRWKVFILEGAERLTLEAANALLKTLEEPPGHSVFLLLVENKAHLLETIQSRAFEIRTPPPPEKDPLSDPLIQILEEKGEEAFFEKLKGLPRAELSEALDVLMRYLVKGSGLRDSLTLFERVYETKDALQANVNQKLALTHLEIQWRRLLRPPPVASQ